jgi:hypothetical protein
MLTQEDKDWLSRHFPGLIVQEETIRGTLRIQGTYNPQTGRFQILGDGIEHTVGGEPLAGYFLLEIRKRQDTSLSRLPALLLEEVEPTPDRHFGQRDTTACLCSPLEEDEFLTPQFDFRK